MANTDEQELDRICTQLGMINRMHPVTEEQSAALKKAALALHVIFTHGLRQTLEAHYDSLDEPLTEDERARLAAMGINPD